MIYQEVALPDPLRTIALCAWLFTIEADDPSEVMHSVPPDGTTNLLLFRFPDGTLQPLLVGPSLAAETIPITRGSTFAGLRLRPEAASCVTGEPPRLQPPQTLPLNGALAGLWLDLVDLMNGQTDWGRTTATLEIRQPADPAISLAVSLLLASSGRTTMEELSAQLRLSRRQVRRRFNAATGISPKQYAGVLRLRHALILSLVEPDWADVALAAGFADQPHLARNIKGKFGAATGRVSGYLGGIRHEFVTVGPDRFVQDERADAA
jgi:AraC-like DNA-binding protein